MSTSTEQRNIIVFILLLNVLVLFSYISTSSLSPLSSLSSSLLLVYINQFLYHISIGILQLILSFLSWYTLLSRIKKNPLKGLRQWFRVVLILLVLYLSYHVWIIRVLSIGFLSSIAIKEGNKKIIVTTTNVLVSNNNDDNGYHKSLKWKLDGTPSYVITTSSHKINTSSINESPASYDRIKNVTEHVVNQIEKDGATPKTPVITKNLFPDDDNKYSTSNFFNLFLGNNTNNHHVDVDNKASSSSSSSVSNNISSSSSSKNVKFIDVNGIDNLDDEYTNDSSYDSSYDSAIKANKKRLPKAGTPRYQRSSTPSYESEHDGDDNNNNNHHHHHHHHHNSSNGNDMVLDDDNKENKKNVNDVVNGDSNAMIIVRKTINNTIPTTNDKYSTKASSSVKIMETSPLVHFTSPNSTATKIGKVVIKKRKVPSSINTSIDTFAEDIVELRRKNQENIKKGTEMIMEELKHLSPEKGTGSLEAVSSSVLPGASVSFSVPSLALDASKTALPNATSTAPLENEKNTTLPAAASLGSIGFDTSVKQGDNNTKAAQNFILPTPTAAPQASNSPGTAAGKPPPSPSTLRKQEIKFDGGIAFHDPLISNPVASVTSNPNLPSLDLSNAVPQSAASSSSSFVFGQQSAAPAPAPSSSSSFVFGQQPAAPAPAPSSSSSFAFGQQSAAPAPAPSSSSSFAFGQQSAAPAPTPSSSSFAFAQQPAAPAPALSSSSSFAFGQQAAPALSSSSSFVFGQQLAAPAPTLSSSSSFSFGAAQSSAPLFGATNSLSGKKKSSLTTKKKK